MPSKLQLQLFAERVALIPREEEQVYVEWERAALLEELISEARKLTQEGRGLRDKKAGRPKRLSKKTRST